MPKILIDENIPLLKAALGKSLSVDAIRGRDISNAILKAGQYDALIVRSVTKVNENLLIGTNVKFVGTSTSGYDNIDTLYLGSQGIAFAYAPGSNANSVAEYVIYAILEWANHGSIKLNEKSIGIAGYGHIGRIVAVYAYMLGMRVYINDPPLRDSDFLFPDFTEYCELDELIQKFDIITNHVPLTNDGKYPTENLLNEEKIKLLRKDSLFLHTSRGGVVDEKALLERIDSGEISAVVDVWESEPDINIRLAESCILATPHIAGYSYDGKLKGALMMAEAIEKHFDVSTNREIIVDAINDKPEERYIDCSQHELLSLLKHSRQLKHDSDSLKDSFSLSDEERIRAFDSQRKNYPVRREILRF